MFSAAAIEVGISTAATMGATASASTTNLNTLPNSTFNLEAYEKFARKLDNL